MLRSLYSGISGMQGFQTKLDVIGNNVANVNTVGYKKSRVMFQDILSQTVAGATAPGVAGGVNPKQIGLGVNAAAIDVVHSPGSPMTTNLSTDLSIDGDGFFIVSPDGGNAQYLTRAGNFTRDANGDLVTAQGYHVLDEDGNVINIPRYDESASIGYTSFSIDMNGQVWGTRGDDGTTELVSVDGGAGDTIGIATVNNPGGLQKLGGSLYEVTTNAHPGGVPVIGTPETSSVQIISGQLEMSNVELTEEFAEMIVAQRGFQANARTITTSDSILEEVVNLKR
ncbi:flagellar basal body rod protein FlgG [Ammoniphilus oxalaticus]|uniref:Flagellar hook protein FlgE n=1 Tax=Ammoniphilus oxalaticus TaxID=66863 RepID=A0A419SJU2_9BACL|nr:flagellar hook-basal body complex protein [Ammoniphilus oxalaticus]RKD24245.1 flagellar basal body rod protein FlgG [Ammoniphilus oxalaticus]